MRRSTDCALSWQESHSCSNAVGDLQLVLKKSRGGSKNLTGERAEIDDFSCLLIQTSKNHCDVPPTHWSSHPPQHFWSEWPAPPDESEKRIKKGSVLDESAVKKQGLQKWVVLFHRCSPRVKKKSSWPGSRALDRPDYWNRCSACSGRGVCLDFKLMAAPWKILKLNSFGHGDFPVFIGFWCLSLVFSYENHFVSTHRLNPMVVIPPADHLFVFQAGPIFQTSGDSEP